MPAALFGLAARGRPFRLRRLGGGRAGRGSALRLAVRRKSGLDGADFRGFRSFDDHRALAILVALDLHQGGPDPSTRVAPVAPAIRAPAHPAAAALLVGSRCVPRPIEGLGSCMPAGRCGMRGLARVHWRACACAYAGTRDTHPHPRTHRPRPNAVPGYSPSAQRQAPARRPSREGAPALRPAIRVKPVALPRRWPRASTRPRWPVDAKSLSKKLSRLQPANVERQPCHARHDSAGDSSQRSIRRRRPQADGGHERRRVPRRAVPSPEAIRVPR